MSIRSLGGLLFRHGRQYLKHVCRRELNTRGGATIAEPALTNAAAGAAPAQGAQAGRLVRSRPFALRDVGLQVGLHARRILIDNVLNRVTNSLNAELRKKATKRMFFGDSGPFFALVGVSLASGTGILTKEEELEGVCWEIREAISKIKWKYHDVDIDETRFDSDPIGVKDIQFGQPIAKGANAVVYSAKLIDQCSNFASSEVIESEDEIIAERINENVMERTNENVIQRTIAESVNKNVGIERMVSENVIARDVKKDENEFPLAVKMMFNYDIQSNGMAILNAMYKETIPARDYYSNIGGGVSDWEIELSNRKRHLPPHPNIVAMFTVFTDYIPELKEARGLYPAALPSRIYPDGEGRNMSLFLIMKRYSSSLQQYVSSAQPTRRTSILLLAQLLEGVAHLTAHGIAHRDLKSDNLLIDDTESHSPILVISDFGCCLAERNSGLSISYPSYEIDKGGNPALMPPEIINQQPGTFSVLNYSKSDLWAAGSIAYEIFGMRNPFYERVLRGSNYKEDELPEFPEDVPKVIRALVMNLLSRSPGKRLDAEVAANVLQLFLWAPSAWLRPGLLKLPTSAEILQWLLTLTTKVLCEGRLSQHDNPTLGNYRTGRRTYTEYLLISSFLIRAKLSNVKAALNWMHNVIV